MLIFVVVNVDVVCGMNGFIKKIIYIEFFYKMCFLDY